jgi:hypothetical protein
MVQDETDDPANPLGKAFQDRLFERGQRLEELRVVARSDREAALRFGELAAEQLEDYRQLLQATERFGASDIGSPVAIFRSAMAREMQQLGEDAERLRSQGE